MTILVSMIVVLLSVYPSSFLLRLDTDWIHLFKHDRPEVVTLREWRETLPSLGDLAIIVSDGTLEERERVVESLGRQFGEVPHLLEAPLYRLSLYELLSSGLFYLTEDKLRELDGETRMALEGTKDLDFDPDRQPDLLELSATMAESAAGSKILLRVLEALVSTVSLDDEVSGTAHLIPKLEYESTEISQFLGDPRELADSAHLSLDGGKTLLIVVSPRILDGEFGVPSAAVKTVREILAKERQHLTSVRLSLTGEPVLRVDERNTIGKDALLGAGCALFLTLSLLRLGFGEFSGPLVALGSLMVGLGWTAGLVSLTIGELNFLTITYIPILIGIGLHSSIHLSFRYMECRQSTEAHEAILETFEGTGRNTLWSASLIAAIFGVFALVGYRGVAELGAIAFYGILMCQLSACTFLPACLGWIDSTFGRRDQKGIQDLSNLDQVLSNFDRSVLVITPLIVLASIFFIPQVHFSMNLLKLQDPRLESVQTELELIAQGQTSVLAALIAVPDLESARRVEEELLKQPTVATAISLATFLPNSTPVKDELVNRIVNRKQGLLELLNYIAGLPSVDVRVALHLQEIFETLDLSDEDREAMQTSLFHLETYLYERGPGPVMDALELLRSETLADLEGFQPLLARQVAHPATREELPVELTTRFLRNDGLYVVRVVPSVDIWQPELLDRFLSDVRTVTTEISGEPVLLELFGDLVKRTHRQGLALSLVTIVSTLAFVLRRPRDVALSVVPTVLSVILVSGLMGLLELELNPANFIALPILLGVGSAIGLQSLLRMREVGDERILLCSTGPAICLSTATSVAGFASLGLAAHQGVASLGWLVAVGLVLNGVLSIVVLPAWMRFRGM